MRTWLQDAANLAQILSFLLLILASAGPPAWTLTAFAFGVITYLVALVLFVIRLNRLQVLNWKSNLVLALFLIGALAIGIVLTSFLPSRPVPTGPLASVPASIVGIEFKTYNWNPRLIDMRKAEVEGIPVSEGASLEFPRIWVNGRLNPLSTSTWVWIEVYEDSQLRNLVGNTNGVPLIGGVQDLGFLLVKPDDGNFVREWRVQPTWIDQFLYFVIVTQQEGQDTVKGTPVKIRLSRDGTAWFLDPPYAGIATIAYRINDGPQQVLDLSHALTQGLRAAPDDELAIEAIWYRTSASEATVQVEAYLTAENYDQSTLKMSQSMLLHAGIGESAGIQDFRWTVAPDHNYLNLTLYRNDGVVLDVLRVRLSGDFGAPGLIRLDVTN